MESPEWTHEESDVLAGWSTKTTPSRNPSVAPAEPIKKTRLFSLANSSKSTAATAVTRTGSTQLNSTASSFQSSQNLDIPNPFFEPDYPSQRFRPEVYEEEDPSDQYYPPPSTFIPPESPNDLKAQDQTSLAVFSPETQVRDALWPISSTLKSNTSDNEYFIKSIVQGAKAGTHSRVRPSVYRGKSGSEETR